MILGINTSQNTHELALIDRDKILNERAWQDEKDNETRLAALIKEMLEESGIDKKEITDIVVISGPASFAALRTGVAFANTFASALSANLHHMDTFELLKRKAALNEPTLTILNAGGHDIGVRSYEDNKASEIKVAAMADLLAEFPHDAYKVISEVTDVQSSQLTSICLEKNWQEIQGHELQTLAEMLVTFGLEGLEKTDMVEEKYLKDPKITKSKNKWKN